LPTGIFGVTGVNVTGSSKCRVEGIKQAKLPPAKFTVRDFKRFEPAHPDSVTDFKMPASPNNSAEKPLGN